MKRKKNHNEIFLSIRVLLITSISIILLISLVIGLLYINAKNTDLESFKETEARVENEMPILVMGYFPPDDNDKTLLSPRITGEITLELKKSQIEDLIQETISFLEEASDSKDTQKAELDYFLIDEVYPDDAGFIEVYRETPYILNDERFCNLNPEGETDCLPDYNGVFGKSLVKKSDLEKETGKDICYYVDELGVKEVWIYSYHGHYSLINPEKFTFVIGHGKYELDLITFAVRLGEKSKRYSEDNAFGVFSDDELWWKGYENYLPECENTYTLFNYEYDERVRHHFRDRIKQFGKLFRWIDIDTAQKHFSCDINSYSKEHFVECMQDIPGENNNIVINGKKMVNWWEFVTDIDNSLETYGRSLLKS